MGLALFGGALAAGAASLNYQAVPDWPKMPEGRTQLGPMHGDVAVSAAGEIYVSTMDPGRGVLVFGQDGAFLRTVPGAPDDFHGFIIRQEKHGEFIYGSRLNEQSVVKMTLGGKVVLTIPRTSFPEKYKDLKPPPKDAPPGAPITDPTVGKPFLRLTDLAVAANGDIFVTDGYASSYVHRFDKHGKYLASFGGRKPPYSFHTLHKIAIDARFSPPRIIGCDRENSRLVHLSLDGEFLGVIASGMRRPAAVCIRGDYAIVGEIAGRVSILDKAGRIVATFGTNDHADEIATNKTDPAKWRPGVVNAPHGVAYDAQGDVFVSEYSIYGRIDRFNLVP